MLFFTITAPLDESLFLTFARINQPGINALNRRSMTFRWMYVITRNKWSVEKSLKFDVEKQTSRAGRVSSLSLHTMNNSNCLIRVVVHQMREFQELWCLTSPQQQYMWISALFQYCSAVLSVGQLTLTFHHVLVCEASLVLICILHILIQERTHHVVTL